MKKNDEYYMKIAYLQAIKALRNNDVPVGAIIVENNKIISKAYNMIEKKQDATCHAEILAIKKASKKKKNWHLENCILYTTMEPCMMCCGAIKQCRIKKIVYGVSNEKYGKSKLLENVQVVENINQIECKKIVQSFFKKIR